jgi:hypothetical protein
MADGSSKEKTGPSRHLDSHGGIPKIERYGWRAGGSPGELAWIPKGEIELPMEYQRPQEDQEQKIREIAAKFDWLCFGALVVVRRPNSTGYFVMDGGGRWSATMRRSDIEKVPCVVFNVDSLGEEARGFLGLNARRKSVTAVAKYKPQLLSGVEEALVVHELCEAAGRKVASFASQGTVTCVASMMLLAKTDAQRLRRLWPMICDICVGQGIHERILQAIFYIDKNMSGPELLTDRRWRSRLLALGYEGILAGATKASAYYAKGGAKVWAMGVVEAMNKGLREENRLKMQGE